MKKNMLIEAVEPNTSEGSEVFSIVLRAPFTKEEYIELLKKSNMNSIDVEFN